MARKTKAEAEQTRIQILDAALELFHDQGFSRTTLEQIARKAGVTRGAIYWHFKDKLDLFMGIKEDVECSTGTRLEDLLHLRVDSLEDMRQGLLRFFRNLEQDRRFRHYFRTVMFRTEYTDELRPLMEQYQNKLNSRQQKDETDLRRLQAAGRVRADSDCARAALSLRALMVGLLHTWLLDSRSFSLVERGGAVLDAFFGELRAEGKE